MAEEVSPESKIYVKEEIEKSRKEIREEVEKVSSKATKTFTTVAVVVGLVTGLGVYGSAQHYISTTIKDALGTETLREFETNKTKAEQNMIDVKSQMAEAKSNVQEIIALKKIVYLPLGTILPSMLDPNSFAKAVGDLDRTTREWALADGRDVTDSNYGKLLLSNNTSSTSEGITLPDLRGMFLRGMNEGRDDGNQDPDDRKAGKYQQDALQKHGHKTDARKPPPSWTGRDTEPIGYTKTGDADALAARVTTVTEANTADETRPKNVAVYFYIKIY